MDSEPLDKIDRTHVANIDEHDLLWNSIANLEKENNDLLKRVELLEHHVFTKEGGDKRQS